MNRLDIVESEGSFEAREFANVLGVVEGSSYTTRGGDPIVWAFDVSYSAFEPRRLIVAGAAHTEMRIYMLVPEDHAFSGLLMAKAVVAGVDAEDLAPHALVVPDPDAFGELGTEHCLQFYVCDAQFGAPIETPGLAAVGLRADEGSLPPDTVLALLRKRTPDGLTTLDPFRKEPWYLSYALLVRAARRWRRLVALDAPAIIIENDIRAIQRHRADIAASGWTAARAKLPPDVENAVRTTAG
jgi:hypothetical protein